MSLIVLLGTWLSCMKLKLETKGYVKDIEIDGGAVMNSLIVTYMWFRWDFLRVYVGFVAKCLHETKQTSEKWDVDKRNYT